MDNDTAAPNAEELKSVAKDYVEVRRDEGAASDPADYASTLEHYPASLTAADQRPTSPLCGCCSVPFSVDTSKSGCLIGRGFSGHQDGAPVPICAVCLTYFVRWRTSYRR
ncbi:MAG TPA: hypothetical protein EYG51_14775 [Pseudomonadales bacterium]|jgi:hypothetical protein|nr:hypothetical protein [Pseudomonadales bacterium]